MNKNFLLVFLLLCCGVARGQRYKDIITTYSGEKIVCTITTIERNKVYYLTKGPDSFFNLSEIESWSIAEENKIALLGENDSTGITKSFYRNHISLDSLKLSLKQWDDYYFSTKHQKEEYYSGYKDRIITSTGDTMQSKITLITEDYIHFTLPTKNGEKKTSLPVDHIKRYDLFFKSSPVVLSNDKFTKAGNGFENKTAVADTNHIKPKKNYNLLFDDEYKHTLKFCPLSLINEYTLKYEYRINALVGIQGELGYIHPIEGQLKTKDFLGWGVGTPFAFNGFVIRTGTKLHLSKQYAEHKKFIAMTLFYKYQEHDRLSFSDEDYRYKELSRKRNVYGLSITFCYDKYFNGFLVELYAGVSLRYVVDYTVNYDYYDFWGKKQIYSTPQQFTDSYFRPAIQAGINIGFGFNGKKKSE